MGHPPDGQRLALPPVPERVHRGYGDKAQALAEPQKVGMVGVNGTSKSSPDLAFGGVRALGFGRELRHYGVNEFANERLVRRLRP